MTDNVDVTPGTGATIATDDVAGVQYQRVKVDLGGDGLASPLVRGSQTKANSLPVVIASDQTVAVDASGVAVPVTDNGGSLTVDGSVTVTQATGTNLHTVIDSGTVSTITNVVHVDDNASTLSVDDGAGSLTVDYATTGSGNATGALRVELANNGTGVLATLGTITNVVHVDDNSGNLSIDDGGSSITVDYATTGSGNATGALRVELANNGTGVLATLGTITNVVHVDDNSGALTVDNGGTFAVQPAGSVAHDGVGTGVNPNLVGGYASAAAPTDVSNDGDSVRAWHLKNGAQATVLTAAGALVGGDATNGLDVDVTRMAALVAGSAIIGSVKITDGTTVPDVLATPKALKVGIVDGSGTQITSFGGGTQYAEDLASVGAESLTLAGVKRQDTPAANANVNADGDFTQMLVDNLGQLWIAGAYKEDQSSGDGDRGIGNLAVRKATPANTSGSDGDYEFLQMSAGRLWASANIDQINGVTPLMGNGATGTGALRVSIASDSTGIVALTTGSAVIGQTTGAFVTVSQSVTRIATTTQYAANENWSDSSTAATAGGFTFTGMARASGGSGIITDMIVSSSNDPATTLQGEIWITDGAFAVNDLDNAAFTASDADALLLVAVIPFTLASTVGGSGTTSYAHVQNLNIGFTCSGSANLRFKVKTKNAYTPASSEVLNIRLKVMQVT